MAFPGRAGRLVARADRAARRRLGRVRRGDRRSAPAALGTDGGRLLRGGRRRPVPHRRRQPDAVRRAGVRARGLCRLPAPAAEGLRRLGGGLARAAPDLSGGAAAADVPATLPRRAVPDLHVAGAVVRGAPRDRPRGGGVGRRAGSLHRTVRELALDLVKPVILLDALEFTPYPDALEGLAHLRERGHRLVVVSNWDCSLPDWLGPTGLLELVDGVVTSADAGAAKPDPAVFRRALELAGVEGAGAVHVGDSLDNDVAGGGAPRLPPPPLLRQGRAPPGGGGGGGAAP